jgi:hypothetical protein
MTEDEPLVMFQLPPWYLELLGFVFFVMDSVAGSVIKEYSKYEPEKEIQPQTASPSVQQVSVALLT